MSDDLADGRHDPRAGGRELRPQPSAPRRHTPPAAPGAGQGAPGYPPLRPGTPAATPPVYLPPQPAPRTTQLPPAGPQPRPAAPSVSYPHSQQRPSRAAESAQASFSRRVPPSHRASSVSNSNPSNHTTPVTPTGYESRAWAELGGGEPPRVPPSRRTGGPSGPSGGGRSRKATSGLFFGRIVATALSVALLASAAFTTKLVNDVGGDSIGVGDAHKDQAIAGLPTMPGMAILLVGADSRTNTDGTPLSQAELDELSTDVSEGMQTDTMMVMIVSPGGDKATLVSIPRDSWITNDIVGDIKGPYSDGTEGKYKENKINSYYSSAKTYRGEYLASQGMSGAELNVKSDEGGRTMLIKVVSKLIGRKIDAYAQVNLMAFYKLSKAIGGVEVCLNAPVDDRWSGAKFPAGVQSVEGSTALAFVRQRHGLPGGDFDRIRRQQAFLGSAIDKVLSAGTLTDPGKLTDLAEAAKQTMVLDNIDLLAFGQQMQKLSSGNVTFATIPTHGPAGKGGEAVNWNEVKSMFAGLNGGAPAAPAAPAEQGASPANGAAVTVDVQNGTMKTGLAKKVGDRVVAAGFKLGQVGNMPGKTYDNQLSTTEIRYSEGAEQAAQQIKEKLGVGTVIASAEVQRGRVLVVVGKDMPAVNGLRQDLPFTVAPAAAEPKAKAAAVPCVN